MLNRRSVLGGTSAVLALGAVSGLPSRSFAQVPATPKPDMIVHRGTPLNAETRGARLGTSFLTPQSDFYIRCHGTIPEIDVAQHRVKIDGQGIGTALSLSVADLRSRFAERTVTAVMQCAGNRRHDLGEVKRVSGDAWGPGAIGNAEWTGVGLAEVLQAAGVKDRSGMHVAFGCLDEIDEEGEHFTYGVSIPLDKAMAADTLIAFSMNGEPLTAEHGFPMRIVTPGYAGVRSPKWLASITVQDKPSENRIQQKEYMLFPPSMTKETVDYTKGITINDMPLNSAIVAPAEGAKLKGGANAVRGYAIATGRPIVRVDVSSDGGNMWHQARLERHDEEPWGWTLWNAELDLPKGNVTLVVRAWDGAGDTQPSEPAEVWNFPGYLSTAYHRVKVQVA